jgi:hypothetical protein
VFEVIFYNRSVGEKTALKSILEIKDVKLNLHWKADYEKRL